MNFLKEFVKRWNWTKDADRLGPDMLGSHFKLYIPLLQRKICEKKFLYYGENADFRIGAYAIGCSNIKIGDNVVIRPFCMLIASANGSIDIQKNALIGPGVHIYVSNHQYSDSTIPIYYQGYSEPKPVLIKEGSWVGANSVILPGVTIGRNAVVAAGSIVTKNVDDFTLVGGNPARLLKKLVKLNVEKDGYKSQHY
ncbi:acyltransferase [Paenisporosarcina quisquiliarum]|uniref:Acyltransferase n=1 Tax=Paenisporosarcina quisquiliarum TaxID=365346 RepID=A0A9X3LFB3_9BACL|nr:acyltransferase [Paenisporosarcina quisquiliarum]MCZ8536932.1 acyltransferase [Paenisporosarcina quisquiliarum]